MLRSVSLVRCWFEFDLRDHLPPATSPGVTSIDGGTIQYAWLSMGAGVTGRDEDDCLCLLRELVGAELPAVVTSRVGVRVDDGALGIPESSPIGNPVVRGVWWPPVNLRTR
jgi:hypothetical protein